MLLDAVLDHPLEALARLVDRARVERLLRGHERGLRGVERARVLRDERVGRGLELACVLRLGGVGHRLVHQGRVLGLARAPRAPAAVAGEGEHGGDDGAEHVPAVVFPPRLQLGDAFLLFEIVGSGHFFPSSLA